MENTSTRIQEADSSLRLFTVGHSNHDLATFVNLLRGAGITTVVDVRSSPYSKRQPQFNLQSLERALKKHAIAYAPMGHLLGGLPRQADLYDTEGHVDYDKVRATDFFREGVRRLLFAGRRYTLAMMCSEADPLDCHRGLMITPALVECGVAPLHLRRDGTVETTAEMEKRLLAATGAGAGILDGLFAHQVSPEERSQILAAAYRKMARSKAYRLRPGAAEEPIGAEEDPENL